VLSDAQRNDLNERGYAVFPSLAPAELLEGLRRRVAELFDAEGEAAGSEFRLEPGSRRLANVVDKGEIFERLILHPTVLEATAAVLGPRFKLSRLNVRSANPRNGAGQPLHADAGAIADGLGYSVANTVWMLDDFTETNGAMRAVPGSHKWRKLPQAELADPTAPHPDEVLVTGKAGTVVVMNAHLWHGGTANATDRPRCAIHAFYTRWDKAQQQYQKKLLSAETQARLSPEARRLLALDDPLNDELCARQTNMSGFLK
jgi:hypothetical protein